MSIISFGPHNNSEKDTVSVIAERTGAQYIYCEQFSSGKTYQPIAFSSSETNILVMYLLSCYIDMFELCGDSFMIK